MRKTGYQGHPSMPSSGARPKAQADKWQKLYYQGIDMEGRAIAPDHRCSRFVTAEYVDVERPIWHGFASTRPAEITGCPA